MKTMFSKKGILALLGTSLFIMAVACGVDGQPASNPTGTPNGDQSHGGVNQSPDNGDNIPVGNPSDPTGTPTPDPSYPTQVVDAPIDGLEIVTDPNDPNKFIAKVTSGLPGGCATFESYGFSQQGRMFKISVQNRVPADDALVPCTMIYGSKVTEVTLGTVGEELEACKTYTVRAGDLEETFQAAGPAVQCPAPDNGNGGGNIISDAQALILTLKSMGIYAELVNDAEAMDLFNRKSTVLEINGEHVHMFEFSPGSSAADASEGVSNDGTTFDNFDGTVVSVRWVAPVRLYLFGNAILLYVGDNQDVIDTLDKTGTQFAGQGYEPTPGPGNTVLQPAPVVSIGDVRAMESYPVQYALTVRTAQPNGCAKAAGSEVTRDGNTFSVTVYNRVPAPPQVIMCTMIYGETDVNVGLGSGLELGQTYTVIVNGDESNKVTFVAQ